MAAFQSLGVQRHLVVSTGAPCRIVRVPKTLAEQWRDAPPDAVVAFTFKDENGNESAAAPSRVSRHPFGVSHAEETQWLDVKMTKSENLYIFKREVIENCDNDVDDEVLLPEAELIKVEGKVQQSTCMIPRMSGAYKQKWKSKLMQAQPRVEKSTKETGQGEVTKRVVGGAAASSAHLFKYYSPLDCDPSGNPSASAGRGRAKRQRVEVTMTSDELQRRLFQVLEDAPDGLSLNDLVRKTGQPQRMVKESVERIAEFRKHKYSMKDEYQSAKLLQPRGDAAEVPSSFEMPEHGNAMFEHRTWGSG